MDISGFFKSIPAVYVLEVVGAVACIPLAFFMGWAIDYEFAAADFNAQMVISSAVALILSSVGFVSANAGFYISGWVRVYGAHIKLQNVILPGVCAAAAVFCLNNLFGCSNAIALKVAAVLACLLGMWLNFVSMKGEKRYYDKYRNTYG